MLAARHDSKKSLAVDIHLNESVPSRLRFGFSSSLAANRTARRHRQSGGRLALSRVHVNNDIIYKKVGVSIVIPMAILTGVDAPLY